MANVFNMGGGTDLVNATLKPGFPIIYSDGLGSHEEIPTEEKTVTVLGSSIVYAPHGLSGEVTPLDRSGFWFVTGDFTAQTSVPVASTTPASGVTYDTGVSDLDPSIINSIARAISNNSLITHETENVYIDMANFHRKISIGDTISIALDDAVHEFRIVGFNSNKLSDSTIYGSVTATGTAGLTLEMVTVYSTPYYFTTYDYPQENNTGSATGYFSPDRAYMYTSVLPAFKEKFPSQWKSLIKSVTKTYADSKSYPVELFFMRLYELDETNDNAGDLYNNRAPIYPYAYYKNATNERRAKLTPQEYAARYYTDTVLRRTGSDSDGTTHSVYVSVLINNNGSPIYGKITTVNYIAPLFCI